MIIVFPLEIPCEEPPLLLNTEEIDEGTHAANQPSEQTKVVIEVFPENEKLRASFDENKVFCGTVLFQFQFPKQ